MFSFMNHLTFYFIKKIIVINPDSFPAKVLVLGVFWSTFLPFYLVATNTSHLKFNFYAISLKDRAVFKKMMIVIIPKAFSYIISHFQDRNSTPSVGSLLHLVGSKLLARTLGSCLPF